MGQAKNYYTFSFSVTEEREPDIIHDIGLSGRVYYEDADIYHHGEIGVVAGTEKEARGLAEGELEDVYGGDDLDIELKEVEPMEYDGDSYVDEITEDRR